MEHKYKDDYNRSIKNSNLFWSKKAKDLIDWQKEFSLVRTGSLVKGDEKWYVDGLLNVSYNCIDRHVEAGLGDKVAYYYESDDGSRETITYSELLLQVSRFANVLKSQGVKKGDVVCIYMPSSPKAIYAMLACARIGAVHTVVFAGFSETALKTRLDDAGCKVIVTVDSFERGGKRIDLLERVQSIRSECQILEKVICVSCEKKLPDNVVSYEQEVSRVSDVCNPIWVESEDPLFILYTSGSTGKPKGVLHTTGGYLVYVTLTHAESFDLKEDDVYWSAADIGWITGHSYLVYGPLSNGCTSVLFDGIPTYPTPTRHWEIIDRYGVTIYYSTPTIIRSLMRVGDSCLEGTHRKSLRVLGTVGEPINPEAWRWYHEKVGNSKCVIVDTWWQTETGGHILTPMAGVITPKPGAAMLPYYGIIPKILDDNGKEIVESNIPGALVLDGSWPGSLHGLYKNESRFKEAYLEKYPGYYCTGDSAYFDEDGHWWVTGRIDDVLNIAGRIIGTAELESAIVIHPCAVEAAVVSGPDEIKGSNTHVFVLLQDNVYESEQLISELIDCVKKEVGSFARPDYVHCVSALPKTRSGKIMRRILRKIVEGDIENIGDISTLANPESVDVIKEYWNRL